MADGTLTEVRKKAILTLLATYPTASFTQADLSKYLGVTRGTVSVLLSDMECRDKTIKCTRGRMPYLYSLTKAAKPDRNYVDLGDVKLTPEEDKKAKAAIDQAEKDVAQREYEKAQPDPRRRGVQKIRDMARGFDDNITRDEASAVLELMQERQQEIERLNHELARKDATAVPAMEHSLTSVMQYRSSPKRKLLTVVAKSDVTPRWRAGDTVSHGSCTWRLTKRLMFMPMPELDDVEVSTWKVTLLSATEDLAP